MIVDEQLFAQQVKDKMTYVDQAAFWKCGKTLIGKMRKERGLTDPTKAGNRVFLNENVFETINTADKAYWLGFLYADGSVSKTTNLIELSLKESDLNHIKKFKAFIQLDNKIQYKEKYKAYKFAFNCKKMKQDLIKQGCVPQKTFLLKFPTQEQVPDQLMPDFMRGYLEGDGCICTTKNAFVDFVGTFHLVANAVEYFNLPKNKIQPLHHSEYIFQYRTSHKGAINEFLDLLYVNADTYLDRKYLKYLEMKEIIKNKSFT